MTEKSQQEAKEKVFKIKESKLTAVLGQLQLMALTAQQHQYILSAFQELKKE